LIPPDYFPAERGVVILRSARSAPFFQWPEVSSALASAEVLLTLFLAMPGPFSGSI
jgi:hypothetical protein